MAEDSHQQTSNVPIVGLPGDLANSSSETFEPVSSVRCPNSIQDLLSSCVPNSHPLSADHRSNSVQLGKEDTYDALKTSIGSLFNLKAPFFPEAIPHTDVASPNLSEIAGMSHSGVEEDEVKKAMRSFSIPPVCEDTWMKVAARDTEDMDPVWNHRVSRVAMFPALRSKTYRLPDLTLQEPSVKTTRANSLFFDFLRAGQNFLAPSNQEGVSPTAEETTLLSSLTSEGEAARCVEMRVKDELLSLVPVLATLLALCALFAAVCIAVIIGLAHLPWSPPHPTPDNYFDRKSFCIFVTFGCITVLAFFLLIEYATTFALSRRIRPMFIAIQVAAVALYIAFPLVSYVVNFPFWWYELDFALFAVSYAALAFAGGYVGEPGLTSVRRRLIKGLVWLCIGGLTSGVALAYGVFFVPWFQSFPDLWKTVWRVVAHPLLFELCMLAPIRTLASYNMRTVTVLRCLPVIHAQAHISTIGRLMLTTMDSTFYSLVTVLIINVTKTITRSTVGLRDDLLQKVLARAHIVPLTPGSTYSHGDRPQAKKLLIRAITLYSEIVMESTSIIVSPVMVWAFYPVRDLFLMPMPKYRPSPNEVASIVVVQLAITTIFDYATLIINRHYVGLPLRTTFSELRKHPLGVLGFALYSMLFMGVVVDIYMCAFVPRPMYCASQNVCSCRGLFHIKDTLC